MQPIALLEPAREEYIDLLETREYVRASGELARNYLLLGRSEEAVRVVDATLPLAERLDLVRETLELIVTRGPALASHGRLREGITSLIGAVASASSYGLPGVELRARVNLSFAAAAEDPALAYRVARDGMELVRRIGMRGFGFYLIGNAAELALRMGDWDWLQPELEEAVSTVVVDHAAEMRLAELRGLRGEDVAAELQTLADLAAEMTELQVQSSVDEVRAFVALGRGELRAALEHAQRAYRRTTAPDATASQNAMRAAAWLGDRPSVVEAVEVVRGAPGRVPAAIRREGEAALAALDGRRGEALAAFVDARRLWHEVGLAFEAAVCALSMVTLLGAREPELGAAADEARATFERLGATPFAALLERAFAAPPPAGSRGASSPSDVGSAARSLAD